MQINWYGKNCFKLVDQEVSVLTDPLSPSSVGLKNPRITSDIVVFSSPEDRNKISSEAFIFSSPGEAEIKNVFIHGVTHFEGKNLRPIFKIIIEDLKICFLGEISNELSEEEMDRLGEVDVLVAPFSEKILNSKKVKKIVEQIEPSLVIPSCWENRNALASFIKEVGLKEKEETDKLKIKKKELSLEKTELVILKVSA
jgi:L-ascorbate metabolism protein UlaG (beta-lactamase superfamily)